MKYFSFSFLTLFFAVDIAGAAAEACINRKVIIELEKNQIPQLKFFFGLQSDLPYTFKESAGAQGIGILEISYRRKKGKDDFPEPLSPHLLNKFADRLSGQFEKFKIKKLSAEFIPGQCP